MNLEQPSQIAYLTQINQLGVDYSALVTDLRRSSCVEESELVSSSELAMEWEASSMSVVDRLGMNLSAPPPVFFVL